MTSSLITIIRPVPRITRALSEDDPSLVLKYFQFFRTIDLINFREPIRRLERQ